MYKMPGEGRHQLHRELKWQILISILVVLVLYLPVLKAQYLFKKLRPLN